MVRPWAEHGYTCYCFDLFNIEYSEHFPSGGAIHFRKADLKDATALDYICGLRPTLIFSFPPCTELAVSGAKHFEEKMDRNPFVQDEACTLAMTAPKLEARFKTIWMVENPVSVLSSLWRQPDFIFNPCDYGGYLPSDDIHPNWPKYIAPRDAYEKKTCIWHNKGFIQPITLPVTPEPGLNRQTRLLGGSSAKTKQIRSETPRGFALATFIVNRRLHPLL